MHKQKQGMPVQKCISIMTPLSFMIGLIIFGTADGDLRHVKAEKASVAGDTDSNGVVNAIDVQSVINEALGFSLPAGVNADVNCNGAVNAIDVQLVINAALGMDIGPPCDPGDPVDDTIENVWDYDPETNPTQEFNLFQVYNYLYYSTYDGPVTASEFADMLIEAPADEAFYADGGPTGAQDAVLVGEARYSGWTHRFGAYRLSDGTTIDSDTVRSAGRYGTNAFTILPANEDDDGQVVIEYETLAGPPATFGIFDKPTAASWTLYSEQQRNFDGYDHFVAAWSPVLQDENGNSYRELFIGIEDNTTEEYGGVFGGADWDYQDLVLTLRYVNTAP